MTSNEVDLEKQELMKSLWNIEMQVSLFHAMHDHKPVGINKHFQMAFIRDKVNSSSNKKVCTKEIWDYLGTLYDINALNDSERLPILDKEVEFELPTDRDGFKDLLSRDYPRVQFSKASSQISASSSSSSLFDSKLAESTEKKESEQKHDIATEEPVKSEQRKRTRHSVQGSASTESHSGTPQSGKRSRRI